MELQKRDETMRGRIGCVLLLMTSCCCRETPSSRPNDDLNLTMLTYPGCDIAIADGITLTEQEFSRYSEAPLLIKNAWRSHKGSFMDFLQSTALGCRVEDHAGGFRFRIKEFQKKYPQTTFMNFDDLHSPLRSFFEGTVQIPSWFKTNPMALCSANPEFEYEYRWLLLGGKGGGSTWHFDPHNTSAWNALSAGGPKRCSGCWVMVQSNVHVEQP